MSIAYRPELQTKIDTRLAELGRAIEAAEADGHLDDRLRSLRAEVSNAKAAVGSGWENVSDAGAQELTRWLTRTHPLVLSSEARISSPVEAAVATVEAPVATS